jgi:hypothetical protein
MNRPRFVVLCAMITAGVAARFIPHPPNFSPVAALGLFAGACFASKRVALLVPLLIMLASDAVLGFSAITPVVYGTFAMIVWLGSGLRDQRSPLLVGTGALASAGVFFVVTNFGVWVLGDLYPRTGAGLATCFAAGIPFFGYTVASDLFYSVVLFGGLALMSQRWPVLAREA